MVRPCTWEMTVQKEQEPSGVRRKLEPLRLSRVFRAQRDTVFRAWSSEEHIKRWFAPETFTVPQARVEARLGGPFELSMRAPSGEEHWIRGTFKELTPPQRLVIDMRVTNGAGKALFSAYTEVALHAVPEGTRLDLVQTYTLLSPEAAGMVDGAPQGWRSTLDQLEREVAGMGSATSSAVRSAAHATFHLERTYDAPVARLWRALTDPAAKQKWFNGPPGRWQLLERQMDVRVGGRERLRGRWDSGVVTTFDAFYHDVIPNERLVYSYGMYYDERKLSVSLATLELKAAGSRCTLKVTEQGAFLDGYDDAGSREQGTGVLLDALGASLAS